MIDLKVVRRDPESARRNIARRRREDYLKSFDELIEADIQFRKLQAELDAKRSAHNKVTREVAQLVSGGGDAGTLQTRASALADEIRGLEAQVKEFEEKRLRLAEKVPNLLDPAVPEGTDESQNVVVRTEGEVSQPGFKLKSHVDLIESLDLADLERAAKIAGARHYFLKNELVLLDMALTRYAVEMLVRKGFTPVYPPEMMRDEYYRGVAPLGDFADVMYKIDGEDQYLIATSEHPLVAMHGGEILDEEDLPLKYVGYSVNFRKEAGAHGKDTKGIFRVHNFNKVEQVVFSKPEDSSKILFDLLGNAEEIFRSLKIPYRVVEICSGDLSPKNARQFDIEAWMPAQNVYREVVSASNCTTYQSVALGIRFRNAKSKEKEYVHTLNSTAVATPRALVAVIENYQTPEGEVRVPEVLKPYMGGIDVISRKQKR